MSYVVLGLYAVVSGERLVDVFWGMCFGCVLNVLYYILIRVGLVTG